MVLLCTAIRRDSDSLLKFHFLNHIIINIIHGGGIDGA